MNEVKADLREYGSKIIDGSISDEELRRFFIKYNGPAGNELNEIVNAFEKYLDIPQLYHLCARLMPLEVEFNGGDHRFMRNKSVAKLCMFALIKKLGFGLNLLGDFQQLRSKFFAQSIEIPAILGSLFKIVFEQMRSRYPDTDNNDLSEMFVFNIIKTLMNNAAGEDPMEAAMVMSAVNAAMNKKFEAYCHFLDSIHHSIMLCEIHLDLHSSKKRREIDNNKITFLNNEVDVERSESALLTWPLIFRQIPPAVEVEDGIGRSHCLSLFSNYRRQLVELQQNISIDHIARMISDIHCMTAAIRLHHPRRYNAELTSLCRAVLNLAVANLEQREESYERNMLLSEAREELTLLVPRHYSVNL